MKNNRVGRNDTCPCGSGKKHKKCCFLNRDKADVCDDAPPIKLSAAIFNIAEPFLKKYPDYKRTIVIIDLAIVAWNISLTTGKAREELEGKMVELMPESLDGTGVASMVELSDILAERKTKLYPDIKHVILSHNLSFHDGEMTLDINSSPCND